MQAVYFIWFILYLDSITTYFIQTFQFFDRINSLITSGAFLHVVHVKLSLNSCRNEALFPIIIIKYLSISRLSHQIYARQSEVNCRREGASKICTV